MLAPKKVKYHKMQKGKMRGVAYRGSTISYGDWGLQTIECGWLTSRQIEAGRVAISRHLKRAGKLWIRVFPDKPISKKPAETRMGKGKGNPEEWVAVIKPGRILFEVGGGVEANVVQEAFHLAAHKLPVKTRVVQREAVLG